MCYSLIPRYDFDSGAARRIAIAAHLEQTGGLVAHAQLSKENHASNSSARKVHLYYADFTSRV